MKTCVFSRLGIVLMLAFAVTAAGQNAETGTAASAQTRVVGVVTTVDKTTNHVTIKTDAGETHVIVLASTSSLLRLPPGETSAQNAQKITLAEIAVGDRMFARGAAIGDGKTIEARQLVVTGGSTATTATGATGQQQRDDFRQRGMVGRIEAIDAQKKEISLQSRGRDSGRPATIVVTASTRIFRYAPDSLNISHASRSSLNELREGDQLRALGERNTDGTRFNATEIIAGSIIRTVGQVVSVDPAKNQLTIKNSQGETLTVAVGERSSLRRITPEVAASFATRPARARREGEPGQDGRPRERRERPAGANGEQRRGGPRGGRGFQEILEGLPPITISELKKGDSVFITGSEGADDSRVTAIMLITGDASFMERFLQRGPNRGPQNPGLPGDVIGGGVGPAERPTNPPNP